MIDSKIASKIPNKLFKFKNIEFYDYFFHKSAKNKNLVCDIQKFHLSNKNHFQTENKIHRGIKTYYKKCFISKSKEIVINFLFLNILIRVIPNVCDMRVNSSYITLKIYGYGNKSIFSSYFLDGCRPRCTQPNEVYINKVKQENVLSYYIFNETKNEVMLIWNVTVIRSNCLFFECKDIKEIDLSYFDTSQTLSMRGMFYECNGLRFLNISYLNTSKVEDMSLLFYNCFSLNSIDLSSFDTSKVI